jgi:hypothetical protein
MALAFPQHYIMPTALRVLSPFALPIAAAAVICTGNTAWAQADAQPSKPDAPAAADISPEVELNLINLPTTMSLRSHQHYFRLTHRFARDLRRGDFGSLVEDLFSLDNGAIIGLEYRFALTRDLQAGVHRSLLSKTIQMFGRYDGWRQGDRLPMSLSVVGSVEGLDNFQQNYQPAIGGVLSRAVGGAAVLYAMPAFVANTRAADFLTGHDDHDHGVGEEGDEEVDEHAHHEHTMLVGLGGRFRVRPTVFVAAEYSPRVAGHDPGRATWGVAIEKKTGGHTLQMNITNSFGTTFGQLARGGSDHDIYLGFNITRRF